jgi:hypothetical protein
VVLWSPLGVYGPLDRIQLGANPTTFEFTTTHNASIVVGYSVSTSEKNNYILKTRFASGCVVNFYNAGVVTRDRRIGSRLHDWLIGVRRNFLQCNAVSRHNCD